MNTKIEELISRIKKKAEQKQVYLVAIDGRGGSGKTTLADTLEKSLQNVTVLHIDDFYLPSVKRILDANIPIDVQRLQKEVLEPLQKKQPATYQRYDWYADASLKPRELSSQGITIIDGWFSLHPLLSPYYDYKIWVEAPKEICLERGIARDAHYITEREGLTKEKLVARWEKYQLLEDEYIAKYKPEKSADVVINI